MPDSMGVVDANGSTIQGTFGQPGTSVGQNCAIDLAASTLKQTGSIAQGAGGYDISLTVFFQAPSSSGSLMPSNIYVSGDNSDSLVSAFVGYSLAPDGGIFCDPFDANLSDPLCIPFPGGTFTTSDGGGIGPPDIPVWPANTFLSWDIVPDLLLTQQQQKKKVSDWTQAIIAAAAAANAARGGNPNLNAYPAFLQAAVTATTRTPDCYVPYPGFSRPGTVQRNVTYLLFGSDLNPFPSGRGETITEILTPISGTPGPASSVSGSQFFDRISIADGFPFQVLQQFSRMPGSS